MRPVSFSMLCAIERSEREGAPGVCGRAVRATMDRQRGFDGVVLCAEVPIAQERLYCRGIVALG